MTVWSSNHITGSRSTYTISFDYPLDAGSNWTYTQPRTVETPRRRRFPALPIAIGHAAFFLALALAGWLR